MHRQEAVFILCLLGSSLEAYCAYECGIAQMRGRRDQMEDRALCLCPLIESPAFPFICFLAVFDGHEGSDVSQYLANHLYNNIKRAILQEKTQDISQQMLEKILQQEILAVEDSLYERVKSGQLARDVGSTAVLALIVRNQFAVIANVGNSRAIICKNAFHKTHASLGDFCSDYSSLLLFQTELHVPNQVQERTRIESTGSRVTNIKGVWRIDQGLELSRSIGDWEYKTKGVISNPEITHITLSEDLGSIVLISDGISEKLSNEEICGVTYEVRHKCNRTIKTSKPDPAIPLKGNTIEKNEKKMCEEARIGLKLDTEEEGEEILGLKGCIDCFTNETCKSHFLSSHIFDRSDFCVMECDIALSLIEEASNRRSSDNLAVVMLSLNEKQQKSPFPLTARRKSMMPGMLVKSQDSNIEYQLVERMMAIPRPKKNQDYNKWLQPIESREAPTLHDAQCKIPGIDEERQPLALFVPLDDDGFVNSQSAWSESCAAPYRLDSVNEQLLRVLGMLPIQDCSSTETSRHARTLRGTEFVDSVTDYRLEDQFAAGGFGEIWRARKRNSMDDESSFVMKRLKRSNGEAVMLSGLREAYFGRLFQQMSNEASNRLVRFVESFETDYGEELWLVFHHEGVSLHSLMYSSSGKEGLVIVEPSDWWQVLRLSRQNEVFELRLIHQLLQAVATLHSKNTTHRDIKPENVLIEGGDNPDPSSFTIRLIDFGSAIDEVSMSRYYGKEGPSEHEQTKEYAPPEALFENLVYQSDMASHYYAYDMWSIGILWLEYIMGTPHVFQLSRRTRLKLELELQRFKSTAEDRERAYLLRSLMEFCIYPPHSYTLQKEHVFETSNAKARRTSLISWTCTEEFLFNMLKRKDKNSVGITSTKKLRLLMSLLTWNPYDRIRAKDALDSELFVDIV